MESKMDKKITLLLLLICFFGGLLPTTAMGVEKSSRGTMSQEFTS